MSAEPVRARVPRRLRLLFRGAFALLALATVALALSVLQDERQRAARAAADALRKTSAQIAGRLRHPAGQLALLNPGAAQRPAQPVHPVVLPFAALDFDDHNKARQAVEMAGCGLQYPDGASFCAAIGSNAYAGGFVYLVAAFDAGLLAAHDSGDLELAEVHRALVDVDYRGARMRWIAPFERSRDGRGRLTGYAGDAPLAKGVRPVRDFRGWLWQEGRCEDAAVQDADCVRRTFLSIRLPVAVLQDALAGAHPPWPPRDLDRLTVRLRLLSPAGGAAVFDSDTPGASLPFSLAELRDALRPGEHLTVLRAGEEHPLFSLDGRGGPADAVAPWMARLIALLPVEGSDAPLREQAVIDTTLGRTTLTVTGDRRAVDGTLAAVATRLAWTVGAMLLAIAAVWLALEGLVIRRITLLTTRAAAVSSSVRADPAGAALAELDLADLRGRDELGVLAQGLRDLLQRVGDHVRRERIRAAQERDLWHAVGHEIIAPLQSLMALHAGKADPESRYIARMQQAVRVLYGQASPGEAFEASRLALRGVDLDGFLRDVAANARYAGIDGVDYQGPGTPVSVQADEHSLEDAVTHVLRNAQRHRRDGTPIVVRLETDAGVARVRIRNEGEPIAAERLERIFEYGVTDGADASDGRRGQGLFVARTYLAKMGATVAAANREGAVEFTLEFPRIGNG